MKRTQCLINRFLGTIFTKEPGEILRKSYYPFYFASPTQRRFPPAFNTLTRAIVSHSNNEINAKQLGEIIKQEKDKINDKDKNEGFTALHFAMVSSNELALLMLIRNGADVNVRGNFFETKKEGIDFVLDD